MIFNAEPVDVAAVEEARRLALRAAAAWFGAWVAPVALSLLLFGPQSGEMAMLGAMYILAVTLVIGLVGTVVSSRYALRALNLDPKATLAKAMIGLNLVSTIWILVVGGFTVSAFLE